jgi:alpha-galactosidase
VGESFVGGVEGGRAWTIGNASIQYAIDASSGTTNVTQILDPVADTDWHRADAPDAWIGVNGQRVVIGSTATPFASAATQEWWGGVRLDLNYRAPSSGLEITRSYAVYPDSAVVESWTTVHSTVRAVTLTELNSYNLEIADGTFRWMTGANTPLEVGGPFTMGEGALDDGQVFEMTEPRRASETNMPWYAVRAADGRQLFGSILWNGQWQFDITRVGDDDRVTMGLPPLSTVLPPGGTLELPHAIVGITTTRLPDISTSLRGFISNGLRKGRPLNSYVTYNTWFTFGTFIDEPSIMAEMDMAAALGVEQFVIDAGWWFHIDPDDPGDYKAQWGTYQVDPERFPNGLGALSDYAHSIGMRFGVWVEPERVAMSTVGTAGNAKERFLAQSGGRYDPDVPNSEATSGQICLADNEARVWLYNKLSAFIADARPDYVKWDNNFWVNCDRLTHGHGATDGNFAHMRGLQTLWQQLRDTFPDLDIEDCASGGNRLSLDMLNYTDAAWMDDQSAPSGRVRHNLEGLLNLFPAPYLLSFTMGGDGEPMDPTVDLPMMFRSRMGGMLGISSPLSQMDEATRAISANQIALYKRIRPILQTGSAMLLTPQYMSFPDQPYSGWDVMEQLSGTTGDAVLMGFGTDDGPPSALVKLKGLNPDRLYWVESADFGDLGTVRGSELMQRGIEVQASSVSRGHVLIVHGG